MVTGLLQSLDQAAVQAITHFNSHWGNAAYTLFQTTVVHQETTNQRVSQHALKIQTVFNLIDMGSLVWGLKTFAAEMKTTPWTQSQVLLATACSVAFFFTSQAVVSLLQQLFNPHKDPQDLLIYPADNISIQFELPTSQLLAQQLYCARIMLNIALCCLSNHPDPSLLSLTAQLYSSFKLYQLKWLNFTRIFPFQGICVDQIEVSYRCLLKPVSNPSEVETCPICLNETVTPESYFCSYSAYHDKCIVSSIIFPKSDHFKNIKEIQRNVKKSPTDPTLSYEAFLKQDKLASCPFRCLERYPFHGYFDVKVRERSKKNFNAAVHIIHSEFTPQPVLPQFLEGLNLVYNTFQAGLVTLQQLHPELASQILPAQRIMLIADAVALVRDSIRLYQTSKKEITEEKITAAALSVLAAIAILWMGIRMRPSLDLRKHLIQKQLENVNVFWGAPAIHYLSQLLLASRIAINLFAAYLTEKRQRTPHLLAASLQGLTLYKISQLPWLKFERTFKALRNQPSNIKELTIGSHLLLQTPVSDSSVAPTLKSLYDYFTNFFNGSSNWKSYWVITKKRNLETSRTLNYDVTIAPSTLQGSFLPYINRITASAIDRYYGRVVVNLK